jgi:hypothetical protein
MNPKEFVEALVRTADSDVAAMSRSVMPILRQSYCATRLSLLVTNMISSRESEPEREEF